MIFSLTTLWEANNEWTTQLKATTKVSRKKRGTGYENKKILKKWNISVAALPATTRTTKIISSSNKRQETNTDTYLKHPYAWTHTLANVQM